jgi:FkbM family methyltransferase
MHMLRRAIAMPLRMARARRERALFDSICRSCGLRLDYDANKEGMSILKEVFVERAYADYFPFYQRINVLDIGGHFGYFAIFAALNSASESRIVTVEPSAHNVSVLSANVQQMGLRHIEVVHGAVSSSSGKVDLHITKAHNCSLIASHARAMGDDGELTKERINSFSLSDILDKSRFDTVDVLKMDCEGAEYAIVYDTADDVFKRIHLLMMEFHDLKDAARSGLAMAKRLQSIGYRIGQFHHLPTTMNLNYGKIIAIRE